MKTRHSLHSLNDPVTGGTLRYTAGPIRRDIGFWQAERGGTRWPAMFGIPYLRESRAVLAENVSWLLCSGNNVEALATLLQDTDDFAPAEPSLDAAKNVAEKLLHDPRSLSGREMMEMLEYGPVADYFALRGITPTFFSGIGLLKAGHLGERPVVEIACGAGHFLYWMKSQGMDVVGVDAVFSKLCLAHQFLGIATTRLICAEAGSDAGLPMSIQQPATVFCHDAFYFFEHKAKALDDFRRIAGHDGCILVGHAHLASADHGAVSGFPLSLSDYRALTHRSTRFFDDALLARGGVHGGPLDHAIPEDAEAIGFIEGVAAQSIASGVWPEGVCLHQPLQLHWDAVSGSTQMDWPSAAFAAEYAHADYLRTGNNPSLYLPLVVNRHTPPIHPGLAVPAPFLRLGCRPLRWGVIGGGWIAADYFAPAFQWLPHANLVALAEPHPARRETFQEIAPVETFESWQAMLDHCSLDAVYVATPNDTHAELVDATARHGVRILCEKPLATNLHDLQRIQAAVGETPEHFFQTAFDQRYHPAHGQIAEMITRGDFGVITQAHIHYACWVSDDWGKVLGTENWRIDAQRAGGGAGFDLLPHCLDLIGALFGEPIDEMQLLYQHRVHSYATQHGGVDDGALMSIRTRGGILVSINVSYNCPEDQPRRRINISGTGGWLEAMDTMGQDPGGEIFFEKNGIAGRTAFSEHTLSGPFLRQLDSVSRTWINRLDPAFPFSSDLVLAGDLIRLDLHVNERERTS